jgi:hypothetical protein
MSDVTFFLTSCKRHDLLKICLESFEEYNTYPIDRAIIIEDSPQDISWCKDILKSIPNVELLNTGGRQGQLRNIDRCYAMIDTPYVFHCEDDFQFTQSGFIEGSKTILEAEPTCVNVWLHPYDACPAEHTYKEKLEVNGVEYYGVLSLVEGEGGLGFTFQPSLHRIADWSRWGNYNSLIDRIAPWCNKFDGGQVERNIARNFIMEGYHSRILSHPGKIGYFVSTGHTRHVPLPTQGEM